MRACQEAAGRRSSAAEIGLLDVWARQEAFPGVREHDAAVLEDIAPMRELERPRHVLLDEDDRRAAAIDLLERLEDPLHRQRRQSEARLVEQEKPRARHEPAPDGAHLLLAARERAGELPFTLAQPRKESEDDLERLVPPAPVRGAAAQLQVVAHGHRWKELAPLRHVGDPPRDDLARAEPVGPPALELDAAGAHGPEPADGAARGRLHGALPGD